MLLSGDNVSLDSIKPESVSGNSVTSGTAIGSTSGTTIGSTSGTTIGSWYTSAPAWNFCAYCGRKLGAGWNYCSGCGFNLRAPSVAPSAPAPTYPTNPYIHWTVPPTDVSWTAGMLGESVERIEDPEATRAVVRTFVEEFVL